MKGCATLKILVDFQWGEHILQHLPEDLARYGINWYYLDELYRRRDLQCSTSGLMRFLNSKMKAIAFP